MAIDAGTVARIIQSRAARAGFDPALLGGHSLKRGALSTGMARGVHPTRLKQARPPQKLSCPFSRVPDAKFYPVFSVPVDGLDAGMHGGGRALSDG
jgi:hypothetical protein